MPPDVAALARRVAWLPIGTCYLGDVYLGRIFRDHDGSWLVLAAGELAATEANEVAARTRLLELVEARARRFMTAVHREVA